MILPSEVSEDSKFLVADPIIEKPQTELRKRRERSLQPIKGETAAISADELNSQSGTLRSEPMSEVDEKYDETIFSMYL